MSLKVVLREWRIESEAAAIKNRLCVNIFPSAVL